jgi:hypothetical protein
MAFSKESNRRNPIADLGGGAFFFSGSFAAADEILVTLSGGGAAFTADSCKISRSGYTLMFMCRATDSEERSMSIVVLLVPLFSAPIL